MFSGYRIQTNAAGTIEGRSPHSVVRQALAVLCVIGVGLAAVASAAADPSPPRIVDCNGNGIEDAIDIADGTSHDCNGNGIPDECETLPETPITSTRVATGLSRPVYVTAPAGDPDRLFIVEQAGRIEILDGGSVLGTPFLNITSLVDSGGGGELGLLSMAFHPDYDSNGYFYVNYTNLARDTVVARYTVSGDPNVADAGSALIILTVDQPGAEDNHNGGQLQFGPDGKLYVGMGDGGGANDQHGSIGNGQNTGTLLGKMLRLDVDAGPPYIPLDNPFVGPGNPLDEIWAIGLRNPWRFSFDALTGDLYIADVGQWAIEEIDFQPADSLGGENYGWRCMEGSACTGFSGCTCNDPALTDPIREESHGESGTCSISGGYVYRGCDIQDLSGTYFYSDWCGNYVRSFRYDGTTMTDQRDRTVDLTPITGSISQVVSFGEDGLGELYIVSHAGSIYKIIAVPEGAVCGNGVLEKGEQCDDGNDLAGDGCFDCHFEDNDLCADAIPVADGTHVFNTTGAETDGPSHAAEGCTTSGDGGQTYHDIWYSYESPCTGLLTVSTCDTVNYDSDLVIYDGIDCGNLSFLACNDDTAGCGGFSSRVTASVVEGNSYLIRLGGWNDGSSGSGTFSVSNDAFPCGTCGNEIVEPGEECDPPDGKTCDESCQTIVCEFVAFDDDFQIEQGWTVDNLGAQSGGWQRGVPVNDPAWEYDPIADSDGSGRCFLTENAPGNTDVDDGFVVLTSPTIDMTAGNISITYDYFLRLTNQDGTDRFLVEINSNDGAGAWIEVARHDTDGGLTWRSHEITQADLDAAGVALTANMRLRFTVNDLGTQSIVEAALDALHVATPCPTTDPIRGGKTWDKWWIVNESVAPVGNHPLYPPAGQQSGSGTYRCKECHGWDYKGADGAYATGSHFTGIPGVFGSTMTAEQMFDIIKLDSGAVPNGHDFGAIGLSDEDIADVVQFLQDLVIDTDTYIGGTDFLGDPAQGETNFTTGGSPSCINCHGPEGTWINFGTYEDPEYLGTVAVHNPWELLHKARVGQPGAPMPSWLAGGGDNQGVADIGRYIQLNFPVECIEAGQCDDADPCTVDTCEIPAGCLNDYVQRVFGDVASPFAGETGATQPDLDDILCVLAAFEAGGGWAEVCPLADLLTGASTCGSDAIIDLNDILALLAAFAADPLCPAPCP